MVFGVSYHVVGRADCPYFARAERIAQMLKQSLGLNDRDIRVEMINPVDWPAQLSVLSCKFGFGSWIESQERTLEPDRSVIVYRPHTGRLVGGEKAFRKEVAQRYGISCDASWGWVQAMARENALACESVAKARAARQQAQPLVIAIVGPAGCGKTTLARRIATHYSLVRVSSGDLVRRAALGGGKSEGDAEYPLSESDLAVLRSSLQSGELVPDSVLLPLISWRLGADDVRRRGVVLDGFPRTEAQANALRDLEGSLGAVAAVLKLEGLTPAELTTRLQGRRIDPVLEDLYHTSLLLPASALVLSRLTVRAGDGIDSNLHPQLRQYDHHITDVLRLFRGCVRDVDARGTVDEVLARMHEVVSPLALEVAAKRMEAAAITAAQAKDQPRPQSAFDAASPGSSSPLIGGARPASRSSPVQGPVTPVFTVAARLPELSSSRRGSMQPSASASALPSSTLVPATDSRRGSRRNSGSNLGDKLLGGSKQSASASSSSSSRPGSRGSSKPSSRRGSATGLSAAALAAAGGVAVHSAVAAGSPVLGSSASSGALNRRVSARRSARASGGVPLVPAGSLRDTAASASVSAGSSQGARAAPRIPADAGIDNVVSKPLDVKRGSTSAAAAAAPAATAQAAEEEVVQLHPKRGSAGSKRGTGTGSTAPAVAAAAAAPLAASSSASSLAVPAAASVLRDDDWEDVTPAQDESDGLSDEDAAPHAPGDEEDPEDELEEEEPEDQ